MSPSMTRTVRPERSQAGAEKAGSASVSARVSSATGAWEGPSEASQAGSSRSILARASGGSLRRARPVCSAFWNAVVSQVTWP